IHYITCIDHILLVPEAQTRSTVQNVDTMIMGMLIERRIATRLYGKVTQMEMGGIFFIADQDLPGCPIGTTIFWSIGTHRYVLPTELTICAGGRAMNGTHRDGRPPPKHALRR